MTIFFSSFSFFSVLFFLDLRISIAARTKACNLFGPGFNHLFFSESFNGTAVDISVGVLCHCGHFQGFKGKLSHKK